MGTSIRRYIMKTSSNESSSSNNVSNLHWPRNANIIERLEVLTQRTRRNENVIITSKRRRNVIWRNTDVVITAYLRWVMKSCKISLAVLIYIIW